MKNSHTELTRRSFLTIVGAGAATLALSGTGLSMFADKAEASTTFFSSKTKQLALFSSVAAAIHPTKLTVSKGFTMDALNASQLTLKSGTVGSNHSFCRFLPDGSSNVKGLLWVSHDSTPATDLKLQGGSVLEVFRDKSGTWKINAESPFNKRISSYQAFSFTGSAAHSKGLNGAVQASGTAGNQFGGQTLWGTILSGENNVEESCRLNGLDLTQYGWVTEIDPSQEVKTLYKHTELGRFRHGAIAVEKSKNNKLVIYMGSDEEGGCLFKYVSNQAYQPSQKKQASTLLTSGTLYAANLEDGQWVPLQIEAVQKIVNDLRAEIPYSINKTKEQLQAQFQDQADVLIYAQEAALLLGATPMDRPAGVKYHAPDKALYIAQTNNVQHGDIHGSIVKVKEMNGDPGATTFAYENIANGGVLGGISCPTTMQIDSKGNIWIATAIPVEKVGTGGYQSFKSNGLFVISPKGAISQFAAAPTGAIISGFSFTPDERSLFLTMKNIITQTSEIIAVRG